MKKPMKKLLALSLALVIVLSLAACGGKEAAAPAATEAPAAAEAPAATEVPAVDAAPADAAAADPKLAEELKVLGESANKLAALYNELVPIAQANGWESDETFVKEANATKAMIQLSSEIYKDPTMLEGKSAQDIIDGLNEMAAEWDTNMREKVSKTYEQAAQ